MASSSKLRPDEDHGGRGGRSSSVPKRRREGGGGSQQLLAVPASPASDDVDLLPLREVDTSQQYVSRAGTGTNVPPKFKLQILDSLSGEIFTKKEVLAANECHIRINMVERNHQGSYSLYPVFANVEIAVLLGDFNEHNWTSEDFDKHIVRPRDKVRSVIAGKLEVQLENGEAYLRGIKFVDNSSFTRSGTFRLAVRLIDDIGERVQEGITDPFIVKDRRSEANKKSTIPSLIDEVWRLKKIAKGGVSHDALKQHDIHLVEDFLRMYYKDEKALRDILGPTCKESLWKTIVDHAKMCDAEGHLYTHVMEEKKRSLYSSSLGEDAATTIEYNALSDLGKPLKDQVEQCNKDTHMTYDGPDYKMCDSHPRPINCSTRQGSMRPGPTQTTGKIIHETDQQETSKGNKTNDRHSPFGRLGSVQLRPFASAHETNDAIVREFDNFRQYFDHLFGRQRNSKSFFSRTMNIMNAPIHSYRKKAESMEQNQVRTQKDNAIIIRKLERTQEDNAVIISKLASIEKQIQIPTQKEKSASSTLDIAEWMQTLINKVDKITCSCRNNHNHEEEVKQQGTAGAQAEGSATNQDEGKDNSATLRPARSQNQMNSPICRDDEIRSESNEAIKIDLCDEDEMTKSGDVKIKALEVNFPCDAPGSSNKDLNEHRASGRDGNRNVLTGKGTTVQLINGECELGSTRCKEGSSKASRQRESSLLGKHEHPCTQLKKRWLGKPDEVPVDEPRVDAYDHSDALHPDNVMRETDNCPRPLTMDTAYNAAILESSHLDERVPENLVQARMKSLSAFVNNEADPSSFIPDDRRKQNYRGDQVSQLAGQQQFSWASHGDQCQDSHKVPGSKGTRNGIEERGTRLAEGFNKAGTRMFPSSWDGNDVPGTRNVASSHVACYYRGHSNLPNWTIENGSEQMDSLLGDSIHHVEPGLHQTTDIEGQILPHGSGGLGQSNSSTRTFVHPVQGFTSGDELNNLLQLNHCVERGSVPMDIEGPIISQVSYTFETSTSAHINVPLVPQQLAVTGAPGSAQGGIPIQMQAPLPSNGASGASSRLQQALPPQYWRQ